MNRIWSAGLLAAFAVSPVHAQDTAAVPPGAGSFTSVPEVVGQCELFAAETASAEGPSVSCVGSAQSFLDSLPSDSPEAVDQSITDLVVALAPLAQLDEACNEFDGEIAEAIRLAASYASTPDQIARINEIAATVAACDPGTTAAIDPLQTEEASPG